MTSAISIRNRACIFLVYVLLMLSAKIEPGETAPSDLWDNLWDNDFDSSLIDQQQDFTGLELGAISPGQLALFEANKRNGIFNDTVTFANTMKTCQAMVVAAYRLSSYVPHFQTQNASEFWEGTVNKIVVQTLHQDVSARSLISKCFGRIRDMGIVIENGYQILKLSMGSKKGIEVAKRFVPAALDKITDCISSVEKLDSNVVAMFAENTETFFNIIGSEAADFAKQKIQWDEQIQQARNKQQELITKLGIKKGEVASNYYLMTMTQKYVAQNEEEQQEAKRRMDELAQLNAEVEKAINNIPQTVERTERKSEGLSAGPFSLTWSKYRAIQVPNPDRESQERYYSDVINARKARLQNLETHEASQRKAIEQLRIELAGYKGEYNRTLSQLEELQNTFDTSFRAAERVVEKALDEIGYINGNASVIYQQIGLQGGILIEALEHVEAFSKMLNPLSTAYSPFAAILNTIKSLVETHVELLSSDEPSDIFLAGTLLIEQAQFLSDYVVGAQQILYANDVYNNQALLL